MIEVFEMRHSPYCIPIVRMLDSCAVVFQRREVPNWDRRQLGELTGGVYYQVPVVVDDGEVIHDLRDDPFCVARHLDARHCGGRFFPMDWAGVHEILIGEFEDRFEGAGFKLCDIRYVPSIKNPGERAMVLRHKERRYGVGCLEDWKRQEAALRGQFESMITPLEGRFQASPFLFGDQPIFADFALYGVLANYTFNNWNSIPDNLSALGAWFARMSSWRVSG